MSSYEDTFNSKLKSALLCAIEHLQDIEQAIDSDGDGVVGPNVNEQIELFFNHLLKFNSCTIIKTATTNPPSIVNTGPVEYNSNIAFFGVYRYSSYKCRKFESSIDEVVTTGDLYDDGDLIDADVSITLSNLLEAPIGEEVNYTVPNPIGSFTGYVVDKDNIKYMLCQLRNHYCSIIKFL